MAPKGGAQAPRAPNPPHRPPAAILGASLPGDKDELLGSLELLPGSPMFSLPSIQLGWEKAPGVSAEVLQSASNPLLQGSPAASPGLLSLGKQRGDDGGRGILSLLPQSRSWQ